MRGILLVVVALFVSSCCCAKVEGDQANTLLEVFNAIRENAQEFSQDALEPLSWDDNIADIAQNWANKCKRTHSLSFWSTFLGEVVHIFDGEIDYNELYDKIAEQGSKYDILEKSCRGVSCGFWTQVVSSVVKSVGCGIAECEFGQLLVCNYPKFAQYTGVAPFVATPTVGATSFSFTTMVFTTGSSSTTRASTSTTRAGTSSTTRASTSTTGSAPTPAPTRAPTSAPTTRAPTAAPTRAPTSAPTTRAPTAAPTAAPTPAPTSTGATTGGSGDTIDYRGTAQVTAVKNQGSCGSCWTYGAVAVVEAALGRKYGTVQQLSEEQILDCTSKDCNGGWPATALTETINGQGGNVNLLSAYPYVGSKSTCAYNAANNGGAFTAVKNTAKGKDALIAGLKAYGPLSVALKADGNAWSSYKSGVLKEAGTTTVNHAVTLVGYDASLNAFIIKNSWGKSWGMSGFCYVDADAGYGIHLNGGTYVTAK